MLQLSQRRTTTPFGRVGRTATTLAALSLVVFAGACSDDDDDPVAPEPVTMELSQTSVTLVRTAGQPDPTETITVTVGGTSNTGVTWSAFRPDIATISPAGVITGLKEGQTFFTATSDADPTVNRSVVVNIVSTIVTTSPATSFTWVGGPTRTVTANVQNNTNTAVTWTSSNNAVATVSATGVVTPVAAGTATITATSVADPTKSGGSTMTVDAAPLATTAGGVTITALTSGTGVTGQASATGVPRYYRIAVPAGATNLTVATTGASSDIDLLVQAATPPGIPATNADYTSNLPVKCVAATASGNETCSIPNPQSRIYYILIDAFEAYSGVTITATVTTP